MQKVIVSKKNYEVSRARNHRPIHIAQSLIPMNSYVRNATTMTTSSSLPPLPLQSSSSSSYRSSDNTIESAIFHKSMYGHVLIVLNDKCHPINAWSDIQGIIPIKCRRIKDLQKFSTLVQSIKPKVLYLNDGEILKSIPQTCKLQAYHNKTLLNILEELQQQSIKVASDAAAQLTTNNIPSFEDMQIMDPTITRKDYKKFKQMVSCKKSNI